MGAYPETLLDSQEPKNQNDKTGQSDNQRLAKKQFNRWIRALGIAKILFENDGYFTDYLDEIEAFIRRSYESINDRPSMSETSDQAVIPLPFNPPEKDTIHPVRRREKRKLAV